MQPRSERDLAEAARVADAVAAAVHDPLTEHFFRHCPAVFCRVDGRRLFAGVLGIIRREAFAAVAESLTRRAGGTPNSAERGA